MVQQGKTVSHIRRKGCSLQINFHLQPLTPAYQTHFPKQQQSSFIQANWHPHQQDFRSIYLKVI
jgi:hypothetical protein